MLFDAPIMVSWGHYGVVGCLFLSTSIPSHERIITIEETAELDFDHPHVVTLEGRTANIEGRGEVSLRELLRGSLRMRADRIVVVPDEPLGLRKVERAHPFEIRAGHYVATADKCSNLQAVRDVIQGIGIEDRVNLGRIKTASLMVAPKAGAPRCFQIFLGHDGHPVFCIIDKIGI